MLTYIQTNAIEKRILQAEELAIAKIQLEEERQHYKNLFELLPDAYIVTDARGTIQQANQAAAHLLNIEQKFLTGKPIDLFLTRSERQAFPAKLSQLRYCDRPSSKTVYHQGEIIPLEPERFWLVERGWVKLSTIDESGEQVLVGIAGPSMPFGSKMTSLSIYQATVLSEEVQLVSVPSSEIDNSSHLKDTIFAQLMQRLQQTESLLAIAGRRQLQSRLQHLLQWLQENFGQKVLQGDRLIVRLTHQELANACSTSRVTISRELSKLKKQGKIMYDSKRHIIFLDKS